MMKTHLGLFFILSILPLSIFAQNQYDQRKISKETVVIVERLAKSMIAGPAVGLGGGRPQEYDNFIELVNQATEEELIQLTRHQEETVRGYAFWALSLDKHSTDLLPIIEEHLQDNESAAVGIYGCEVFGQKVGDFLINIVTPGYADAEMHPKFDLKIRKFSPVMLQNIDQLLLNKPNILRAKSKLFLNIEPSEKIYPRIRNIVETNKDHAATVVLAKYKKQQDVSLILKSLTEGKADKEYGFFYAYQAITHFPHPDFLPVLESLFKKDALGTATRVMYNNEERQALYDALVQYKTDKALTLFNSIFDLKKKFHRRERLDALFMAIRKQIDPLYTAIYWKLWEDENRVSFEQYEYLSKTNPEKAYLTSVKSLQNIKLFLSQKDFGLKILIDNKYKDRLASMMLDLIIKRDKELAYDIIRNSLKVRNVLLSTNFVTKKIIQIQDKSFVEPLFEQLDMNDHSGILVKVAKVLLTFNDKIINIRVYNEFNSRISKLKYQTKILEIFVKDSNMDSVIMQ